MFCDTPLGLTKVYGEVTLAQNLDRGLFIADPVQSGTAYRELGWYVAVTQEVMKYGLLGFRYDYYDPNADFFDHRSGLLIPYSSQRSRPSRPSSAWSSLSMRRSLVQYDIIRNFLRPQRRRSPGRPEDEHAHRFACRWSCERADRDRLVRRPRLASAVVVGGARERVRRAGEQVRLLTEPIFVHGAQFFAGELPGTPMLALPMAAEWLSARGPS